MQRKPGLLGDSGLASPLSKQRSANSEQLMIINFVAVHANRMLLNCWLGAAKPLQPPPTDKRGS